MRFLNSYSAYEELLNETVSIGSNEVQTFKVIGVYHKDDELKEYTEVFKNLAWHFSLFHDTIFAIV